MILLISILGSLVIILGYTTFNLLKKNEVQEDILRTYWLYLDRFDNVIKLTDKKLKDLDARGSFEADDEIGFFFQNIKELQSILNEFQVKEI